MHPADFFRHIKVPAKNVTIMDFENRAEKLKQWTKKGVHFVRDRVTEENMGKLLKKYVGQGDILIDLAWNIDTPRSCSGATTTA